MSSCCTFAVKLKPRARRDALQVAPASSIVQVSVTVPPVDNKANERCVKLLSKKLRLPRSSLSIIKGGHCRDKVISCEGLTVEEVFERLTSPLPLSRKERGMNG